jgi:hypothetical protein
MSIVIYENLEAKTVPEIKKILDKLNISDKDIKGTGKNKYITKADRIIAIQDYYAKKSKKKSIKISPPKKSSKKKSSPIKKKKSSKESPKKKKKSSRESPKKKKKSSKKESPIKKSKKESPKKKKKSSPKKESPKKKSPLKAAVKRTKANYDKCGEYDMTSEDLPYYKKCGKKQVCNLLTGNCVSNIAKNTKNKDILRLNEQKYIGDSKKLKSIIGGEIINAENIIGSPKKIIGRQRINISERVASIKNKAPTKEKKKSPLKKSKTSFTIEEKLIERPKRSIKSRPLRNITMDNPKTFAECLSRL